MLSNIIIEPDDENTHDLYSCNICYLEFDIIERLPMVAGCGHSMCAYCSKALIKDTCPSCTNPVTWVLNIALFEVIVRKERKTTSCSHSTLICNTPVEKKLICEDIACQVTPKITCVRCYGLLHAGCKGKSIGNDARYYLSNFGVCLNKANIATAVEIDHPRVLDEWKKKFTKEALLILATRFYFKFEYLQLDSSLITGDFLQNHFLKEDINHNNKKNLYQVIYDPELGCWLSTIDKANTYFFTNSSTESIYRHNVCIFLNILADRLSRLDNEHVIVNCNGELMFMYGYTELINGCLPQTILEYVRVFVFKLFKDIPELLPPHDFTRNWPNGIQQTLTSNNMMRYTFMCYSKNSEGIERIKNDYCYLVESHYRQIVICVRLDKKNRWSETENKNRHIIHHHTSKKRHLIRKTNK